MSEESQNTRVKKVRSLDEEIAAAQEKLARLQAQKRDRERKDLERNQKAIYTMLRTEKLDVVPIEVWNKSLPALRKLFKISETKPGDVQVADQQPAAASNDGAGAGAVLEAG